MKNIFVQSLYRSIIFEDVRGEGMQCGVEGLSLDKATGSLSVAIEKKAGLWVEKLID